MFEYLIVILDKKSKSFCYYNNPNKKSEIISLNLLKDIIKYSKENNLHLNFLYGKKRLPKEHDEIINTVNHVKFIPADLKNIYEDSIKIINSKNFSNLSDLNNKNENVILRIDKKNISNITNIVNELKNKVKRINLLLLNIQDYKKEDLELYKQELIKISRDVYEEYKSGHSIELNFISDRFLLNQMNNCNAGVNHLTIAPNGNFYICPGFYFDNEKQAVGSLKDGIDLKNKQLYQLDHAPICSICDAYQCKRCIYLNKKTTLEVNTPSYQQCNISHFEREASRSILLSLNKIDGFSENNNFNEIPEIDYIDPLEVLMHKAKGIIKKTDNSQKLQNNKNNVIIKDGNKTIHLPPLQQMTGSKLIPNITKDKLDDISVKELLYSIYEIQKQILNKL